jgi:hypothetical protein
MSGAERVRSRGGPVQVCRKVCNEVCNPITHLSPRTPRRTWVSARRWARLPAPHVVTRKGAGSLAHGFPVRVRRGCTGVDLERGRVRPSGCGGILEGNTRARE